MSLGQFSATLSRLLQDRTQAEVAAASSLPRSSIANYAIGKSGITVGALTELLKAFPDPLDQFDLIRAHLRDEIPATHYEQIDVVRRGIPDTGTLAETNARRLTKEQMQRIMNPEPVETPIWRKNLEAALETIRVAAEKDSDTRDLVFDLAKVLS